MTEPQEPRRRGPRKAKPPTETSTFGVSRRESHDASRYYERALAVASEMPLEEAKSRLADVPDGVADRLYHQSSEQMAMIPNDSVALMVTSPSYHVGKDYDTDATFPEYLALLQRVFEETYRVLEPGGRVAINMANLGRKPYVDLRGLISEMCKDMGFLPRGEIIWIKARGASGSCAWGTWLSPKNPTLRDLHEYIVVMSKGRFERIREGTPTVSKEDFMASTLSIWEVRPESAKRVKHPAPFPVELPRRLIELYTYAGDVVLDPFVGSGSTAVAAARAGRRYIGFDLDVGYLAQAEARIAAEKPTPDAA